MKQYLDLLRDIKANGVFKGDRTGTGTQSVFGRQMRFDLSLGFPLVTTKKVHLKSVIVELLWFLQGNTNTRWLNANGCKIWNEWCLTEEHTSLPTQVPVPTEKMHWVWDAKEPTQEKLLAYGALTTEEEKRAFLIAEGIPAFYTFEEMGCQNGDLGKIYSAQWRSWACPDGTTIDQISEVIKLLKTKPDSRRLIVSAWNPADLPDESISPQENVLNGKMALAACHTLFQFYTARRKLKDVIDAIFDADLVERYDEALEHLRSDVPVDGWVSTESIGIKGGGWRSPNYADEVYTFADLHGVPTRELSCQLYQRSGDSFIGIPFNIASYALLTHMIAHVCNMVVGEFIHTLGDAHIYNDHSEQVDLQLTREPKPLPTIRFARKVDDIFDFTLDDIIIEGYDPHEPIKGKVAV